MHLRAHTSDPCRVGTHGPGAEVEPGQHRCEWVPGVLDLFSRRLELFPFQGLLQALSGYAFLYPSPGTCGSVSACKATPSGARTWGVTSSNYQSSFCWVCCLFLAVFFAWAQTAAWKKSNFAREEDFILTHGIGIAHHNEEGGVATEGVCASQETDS